MKHTTLLVLCLVTLSVLLVAGCTQAPVTPTPQPTAVPTAQPADTVKTADTSLGKIIVDAQGKTLYYFANDIAASGASSCNGQCAALWPPFSTSNVKVSAPLDPADFGSITRTNGTTQTTYYGWPLYYYFEDTAAGEILGQAANDVWWVVSGEGNPIKPASVKLGQNDQLGKFLVKTHGEEFVVK